MACARRICSIREINPSKTMRECEIPSPTRLQNSPSVRLRPRVGGGDKQARASQTQNPGSDAGVFI
jgi:hypothetical protein